ncbi:MAG: PduL/EutD family phosphate acyltransferase, partial [Candidatus Pacebacteria bacterium]|nr:PduL/EutD family phosphate acyltransferase [Candidatus Paceibacterota bacterium]
MKKIKIPVEVSARHAHISQEDFYKLFKKNNLTPLKDLGQNQFAAKETIDLICGKRS